MWRSGVQLAEARALSAILAKRSSCCAVFVCWKFGGSAGSFVRFSCSDQTVKSCEPCSSELQVLAYQLGAAMQELAFSFESLCFAPWRSPLLIAACRTQSGPRGARTLLTNTLKHSSTAVEVHLELLEQSARGTQIGHETVDMVRPG